LKISKEDEDILKDFEINFDDLENDGDMNNEDNIIN